MHNFSTAPRLESQKPRCKHKTFHPFFGRSKSILIWTLPLIHIFSGTYNSLQTFKKIPRFCYRKFLLTAIQDCPFRHFRIKFSLFNKARPAAQPFIWKRVYIHTQIKVIYTWKNENQASLWGQSWLFNGLFNTIFSFANKFHPKGTFLKPSSIGAHFQCQMSIFVCRQCLLDRGTGSGN